MDQLGSFISVIIEPFLIIVLFFSLVPLSYIVNRPRFLKRINLDNLLSEILGKDVNSIKPQSIPPQMHSSIRCPPLLNIRPTEEEKKIVQCIKPSSHCQNCNHCTKTAIMHRRQWVFCNNMNRVTTDGSNRHYWHTPELALPCHSCFSQGS